MNTLNYVIITLFKKNFIYNITISKNSKAADITFLGLGQDGDKFYFEKNVLSFKAFIHTSSSTHNIVINLT